MWRGIVPCRNQAPARANGRKQRSGRPGPLQGLSAELPDLLVAAHGDVRFVSSDCRSPWLRASSPWTAAILVAVVVLFPHVRPDARCPRAKPDMGGAKEDSDTIPCVAPSRARSGVKVHLHRAQSQSLADGRPLGHRATSARLEGKPCSSFFSHNQAERIKVREAARLGKPQREVFDPAFRG